MSEWDSPGMDSPLSLDKRLRLLSNRHRRQLLTALLESDAIDETDLPETIASEDEDVESLLVQMYHVHLPMLNNELLVDWRQDEGTVRRGQHYEEVEPLVELVDQHYDRIAPDVTEG